MKIYKSAIVGCGRIGCFFNDDLKRKNVIWTHAGAYKACRRTQLVALADMDSQARLRAARLWGIRKTYATLEAMLDGSEIDILSICTPSSSHQALFQTALSAGVPAIWCEKPMTRTVSEADRLASLSRRCVTLINHTRRWDKAYEIARRSIVRGQLGRLMNATAWYTNGVANMGSHLFDILRFLLGEAQGVRAAGTSQADDPTLSGHIYFHNGVLCHIVGCEPGHAFIFEIDIIGTEGRLRISEDGSKVELFKSRPSPRYSGYREFAQSQILWKGADGRRMVTALEDLVQALDRHRPTRSTAVDGVQSVELISAFLQSARTRRSIELPLPPRQRLAPIPVR